MRKGLLIVCSILAVMAFAGCSMPSFGSGNSLGDGGGIHGSDLPDDSKDPGENSSGGSGGEIGGEDKPTDSVKPDGSGGNAGGGAEDTGDPTIPPIPDDVPEIPADKIYVDVQYFTIHTQDGKPLRGGYFVDKKATLNEFFIQNYEEIMRDYNEGQGFEEGSYAYDKQFFEESFWQYGSRLMYGEDRFIDFYTANASADGAGIYFPLFFTPSGAGPNFVLHDGEYDSDPAYFPFPVSVRLRDVIDWAYNHGIFEMSYDQSLQAGVWQNYWSRESIGADDCPFDEIIFVRNEDVWDDPDIPKENRFTVYMPGIYDYQYYEDGTPEVGGVKDFSYEFVGYESGITIEEAKNYACDPNMEWVYYMNGERVNGDTLLMEESVVVCVCAEADQQMPEFTITIDVDGHGANSYSYRAPVTIWEVAQRYCKEKGLNYYDYVWDCEAVSFQPFQPIVCDRWISAVLYSEPVQPTESYVSVRRCDGGEETISTYAVPYGMQFDAFVREYLLPEYTYETAFECEYAFYVAGDGMNEFSYASLQGSYNLWMIKRSVLEQGYNVSVDLTTRDNVSATGSRPMYYPATLRALIWEVTGCEIWSLDMYNVTVNGSLIEYGGKDDFFYLTENKLYYTNLEIIVKPIFEIGVFVVVDEESSKSATLTYSEDVTPRRIAQDLGLSRDAFDYLWAIGWDSMSEDYVHPDDGLMLRVQSRGAYLFVKARKVLVGISLIRENGEEMNFDPMAGIPSGDGWDWSVTVQDAAANLLGDECKDYNWRVKDSNGEREVTLDDVLEFNMEGGASYDKKYTYYTLVGTPKRVQVEVVIQGDNGTQKKLIDQEIDGGTTIGNVLYELGYRNSNQGWSNCVKDGKEYSYWVEGYNGEPLSSSISGKTWGWMSGIPCSIRIVIWETN